MFPEANKTPEGFPSGVLFVSDQFCAGVRQTVGVQGLPQQLRQGGQVTAGEPPTRRQRSHDVSCFECGGKGCPLCKHTGWIEVLGAGVVHHSVLENCGIDPNVYSGFAFGIGIERIAMLKYGINNIGLMFENDLRFLKQFED